MYLTVVSTNPENGNSIVPASIESIYVEFGSEIDPLSVNGETFFVTDHSGVNVDGTLSSSGYFVIFTPGAPLSNGETYTVCLPSDGITDIEGLQLAATYTWAFGVVYYPPLQIMSITPSNGATMVPPVSDIRIVFNNWIASDSVLERVFLQDYAGNPVAADISVDNNTIVMRCYGGFEPCSTYTFGWSADSGIQDLSGQQLTTAYTGTFTTEAWPLEVIDVMPRDGTGPVYQYTEIQARLSNMINPASLDSATFYVTDHEGTTVDGSFYCNGRLITFTPDNPLASEKTYTAHLTTGISDRAGQHLAGPYTWTFNTLTEQTMVISTDPARDDPDVKGSQRTVTATFNREIDADTVNAMTFEVVDEVGQNVEGSLSCAGNTVIFTADQPLQSGMTYYARVNNGMKDTMGNQVYQTDWRFTIELTLNVMSTDPLNLDDQVPASLTAITAAFNRDLDETSVNENTFYITEVGGNFLTGTVDLGNTQMARFIPSRPLQDNTAYTATLTDGIKDTGGSALPYPVSWTFTTGPDRTPPVTGCQIAGTLGENRGQYGWYIGTATVTLTATDYWGRYYLGGPTTTNYRIDGGEWTSYAGPIVISETGEHTLTFYSVDASGNEELSQSVIIPVAGAPSLHFEYSDGAGNRGNSIEVTLIREGDTSEPCTVTVARTGGDAIADVDYQAPSSVTFDPGQWSSILSIYLMDGDSDRYVNFTLTDTTAGIIGDPAKYNLTILASWPNILFDQTEVQGYEGHSVTVTVYRDGYLYNPTDVDFNVTGGTAVYGTDFRYAPDNNMTLHFEPYETSKSINIELPVNDEVSGTTLQAIFQLSNATGGNLVQDQCILNIIDVTAGFPTVQFSSTEGHGYVNHPTEVSVVRTGRLDIPLDVTVTKGGSAWCGYEELIEVYGVNYNIRDFDWYASSLVLHFEPGQSSYTLVLDTWPSEERGEATLTLEESPSYDIGEPAVYTFWPHANSGLPMVEFVDSQVAGYENETAMLVLTRYGNPAAAFDVGLEVAGGTAEYGVDYVYQPARDFTVHFGPNELSKNIEINLPFDEAKGNVYANFTLANPDSGAVRLGRDQCNLTIRDHTFVPGVEFETRDAIGEWGTVIPVTLIRTGDTSDPCEVTVAITGGNLQPWIDYVISDQDIYSGHLELTMQFEPGQTSAIFGVFMYDNNYEGADRYLNLTLMEPSGTRLGKNQQYNLIIKGTNSPVITALSPADQETDVPVDAAISATFDEDISIPSIQYSLSDGSEFVPCTVSAEGRTVSFGHPKLGYGRTYTVTISGVEDARGTPMTAPVAWSFTTVGDATAPVTLCTPEGTSGDNGWYTTGVSITLAADDAESGVAETVYRLGSGNWITYSGTPFVISDEGNNILTYFSTDVCGNQEPVKTLIVSVDTVAPGVISTVPVTGASGISTGSPVTATFSEDVDSASAIAGMVFTAGTGTVPGTVTYDRRVATFTPITALSRDMQYTVTVSGVKDLAGNEISPAYSWSFQTEADAVPAQDAEIVSFDIPDSMPASNLDLFTITVKNTGKVAWSAEDGYMLAGLDDASKFGFTAIHIQDHKVVQPGETYKFLIAVLAPSKSGTYHVEYQMACEGTGFGDIVSKDVLVTGTPYNADISAPGVPVLKPGQSYTLRVTVKNTGTLPWFFLLNSIRLNGLDDSGKFGFSRANLPLFSLVMPGESYTFNVKLTAPKQQGTYKVSFQAGNGGTTFGPVYSSDITVKKTK